MLGGLALLLAIAQSTSRSRQSRRSIICRPCCYACLAAATAALADVERGGASWPCSSRCTRSAAATPIPTSLMTLAAICSVRATSVNATLWDFERNHVRPALSISLMACSPSSRRSEILRRHLAVSRRLALCIAFESVIAAERALRDVRVAAHLRRGRPLAEDYNGQQGDPWDAQKDMALAADRAQSLRSLIVCASGLVGSNSASRFDWTS